MENLNLFMKNEKNKFSLESRKGIIYIHNNLLLKKIVLSLFIVFYSFLYLYSLNNIKYSKDLSFKSQMNIFSRNVNDIIEPFINQQNDFCNNLSKYYNKQIEKEIQLMNVKLNGLSYKMFTHKKKSGITMSIIK